jgi:hypothetical protein
MSHLHAQLRVSQLSSDDKSPRRFASTDVAETRYIDVREPGGPVGGVFVYYAVLAYPCRAEWPKRRKFVETIAAMRYRELTIQGGGREQVPTFFRRFKREKMLSGINLGWKRIERRISAGIMAWCVCLNERRYPYSAPTPDGKVGIELRGPNTVNKAIHAFVANRQSSPNPVYVAIEPARANVAHRVWAESFPVLHLAMSNPITVKIVEAQVNHEVPSSKQIAKDFFDSMHEPGWLCKALEDAEKLKLDLRERLGVDPNDPRGLGYKPEKAISLLPTEDPSQAYRL